MPIDVSLVILTWNRWESVHTAMRENLRTAGYPIHEIVHVDNGSEPGFVERFKSAFQPSVQILHATNQGVAKGYNRGLALASGSHIVITGCDRVMPDQWLKTWVECFEAVPHTGVIACYSQYEESNHEHSRFRGEPVSTAIVAATGVSHIGGIRAKTSHMIRSALPVEARMHSKEFLFKTGFWREDFGLYGYEDAEWADRADRVARENGLINYVVSSMPYSRHLSCSDFAPKIDGKEYWRFKRESHQDPRLKALYRHCKAFGSPYYNPYYRTEPVRLLEKE